MLKTLKEKIVEKPDAMNELFSIEINKNYSVRVYINSIIEYKNSVLFIGKDDKSKWLFIFNDDDNELIEKLEGEFIESEIKIKRCLLNTKNRIVIQEFFPFTVSRAIGLQNSFGFGDRLGLANAGHIRSLYGSDFKPILAQQSIRELTRTNRTPDEVMDAAVWAVFQEGYKNGFGSDADHLKTTSDIDLMLNAGFTMFTFDPSDHVDNQADNYSEEMLYKVVAALPWNDLNDAFPSAENRYLKKEVKISDSFTINVDTIDFLRAYAKYGKAVVHIKKMYEHLRSKCAEDKFEVEVSVDETESVTSPFEHYFFANELTRLGVKYVSLAPRFVGSFEKGIDYKGDLDIFKKEYQKHLAIVKHFGNYKISLHSGSDKFSVYKVIGSLREAITHVKTAGTSYLEALKVIAAKQPDLFREILDFCSGLYENEKLSYHVSANLSAVKQSNEYSNAELVELFNSNDLRQVLHVTFGKVLTEKKSDGSFLFKDRIMQCLIENEETHYDFLIKHFHKHLEPFK